MATGLGRDGGGYADIRNVGRRNFDARIRSIAVGLCIAGPDCRPVGYAMSSRRCRRHLDKHGFAACRHLHSLCTLSPGGFINAAEPAGGTGDGAFARLFDDLVVAARFFRPRSGVTAAQNFRALNCGSYCPLGRVTLSSRSGYFESEIP